MKKGQILVSNYTLVNDIEFNKTLILIVESNNEGIVGFVFNKESDYQLSDCDEKLRGIDLKIYKGGPVMIDSLHFIHRFNKFLANSSKVTNEIYWGTEFEKAIELIKNGKLKKNDVKFFLGYSGWNKNQLKAEIEDGSWHILKKINVNDVIEDKSNLWKLKLEELGEYFKIWSNSPENPNLN